MASKVNLYQVQTKHTTVFTQDYKTLERQGYKVVAKFRLTPRNSHDAFIAIPNSYFQHNEVKLDI